MLKEKFKTWIESEKGRRIVLACFLVFATGIIVLSIYSISGKMKEPFGGEKIGWTNYVAQRNAAEIERLKNTDTDGDGLSDFEEIYIYGTSPYLADTSGDGVSDYDAIFVHEIDPLCHKEKGCGYAVAEFIESVDTELVLEGSSVSDIRQELLMSGISPDLLDQVDDDMLMSIYQDTVSSASSSLPVNSVSSGSGDMPQYTAGEVREAMIFLGIDSNTLSQVSDEDLLASYYKTRKETGEDPIALMRAQEEGNLDHLAEYYNSPLLGSEIEDLEEIKSFLLQSGITQEELDMFSDDDLRSIIKETQKNVFQNKN